MNRIEGGCVSHIRPEHLLDISEFKSWSEMIQKQNDFEDSGGYKQNESKERDSPDISLKLFHLVSKKAWLDCLLQLLKVKMRLEIIDK